LAQVLVRVQAQVRVRVLVLVQVLVRVRVRVLVRVRVRVRVLVLVRVQVWEGGLMLDTAALARLVSRPNVDHRKLLEWVVRDHAVLARPEQLRPPDAGRWWYIQAGRRWGKTFAGANYTLDLMERWGPDFFGGACSKNMDEVRYTMLEGPSGMVTMAKRRGYEIDWQSGNGLAIHPSGARLRTFSGEREEVRGMDASYWWLDELPWWKAPVASWININTTLSRRSPPPGPHGVITSSPRKRSAINQKLARMVDEGDVYLVRGATSDNAVNLDPNFLKKQLREMQDRQGRWTQTGRQEWLGEFLDDGDGGWSREMIDDHRIEVTPSRALDDIVVGYDPAVTDTKTSDDSGIVAVGLWRDHQYVLADRTQSETSPVDACAVAIRLANELGERHHCRARLVIEDNQGKDMLRTIVRMASELQGLPEPDYQLVTATKSKSARAEAAVNLWERGLCYMVGEFPELEDQMVEWAPGGSSPDRMDALVHAQLAIDARSSGGSLFSGY